MLNNGVMTAIIVIFGNLIGVQFWVQVSMLNSGVMAAMFELKIGSFSETDPNLVVFSFDCKSLC